MTTRLVSGVLISMVLLFSSACATIDMATTSPEVSTTKTPDFGMMQRFVGQKFVSGNTFLEIADEDQGQTLIIKYGYSRYSLSEYRLRTTAKRGRLQDVNNPKSDINLDDDGVLTIKDFDKRVFRVNHQQLPSVDSYRREYGAWWDSHNFDRRLDFVALTDDNERIEQARKLADDQQRREAARAKREASLETARAWAGALSGAAQAVTQSAAQMAPTYGAGRYTNAEIAAGARENQKFAQERQKQRAQEDQAMTQQKAQEQAQEQASEQASEQQRQTQAYNAHSIVAKKQAAQEHQQAEAQAQAQAERKAKLVAQQRAANTTGTTGTTGKPAGKPIAAGVLIVDDSAHQARLKHEANAVAMQNAADRAAASAKAKNDAISAKADADYKAAAEEERRKRKLRGNRQ